MSNPLKNSELSNTLIVRQRKYKDIKGHKHIHYYVCISPKYGLKAGDIIKFKKYKVEPIMDVQQ